ncbi:MAG: hypothetical protein ACE5DT_07855 [Nitrosopumilus sp.]
MLIDDTDKLLQVIVDSYTWGDLYLNEKVNLVMKDKETKFLDDVHDYMVKRIEKKKISVDLLVDIFVGYLELRGTGQLLGILKDREYEKEVKTLKEDNEKFAKMIEQVYVPMPDKKVGTF